jgi:hypothetical protein
MSNRKIRGRTVASAAVVAAAVGIAGFAFTASNTVPNTKAGDGAGTITGFVASSVHYTLNSTNPRNMDAVSFTLDSAPIAGSTIRAQVVDGGTWYACTNTAADVTCDTTVGTQATVVSTNQLRVVVAQ